MTQKALLSRTVVAVDKSENAKVDIHVYEFWKEERDQVWKLKSEETFWHVDGEYRWIPSIAIKADCKTCLVYSFSNGTAYPSIGMTRRDKSDTFTEHIDMVELVAFKGKVDANVQKLTSRGGDFSVMTIDPSDDSCWFTTEFAKPNSMGEKFGWGSEIVSFGLEFKVVDEPEPNGDN